jgi:hypothetical protein
MTPNNALHAMAGMLSAFKDSFILFVLSALLHRRHRPCVSLIR